MTIKHLTGAYPDGYRLSAAYSGLVIESTASVGGSGVIAFSKATITNLGQVSGSGSGYAVQIASSRGGTVTNGSASDTAALIEGDRSGVYVRGDHGAVTNFGTISGAAVYGVRIGGDGAVVNGSAADTAALITGGYSGVYVLGAGATVTNFGTMSGAVRFGIRLGDGGMVTNGSNADTRATIEGATGGIYVNGQSVTIANYGTITATSRWGVVMDGGGLVTNGSATDTTALIEGGSAGVDNQASGATVTVDNFGTIKGGGSYAGVFSNAGVTVTNGSARDVTALIEGLKGVESGGSATITNFGTIQTNQGHGVGTRLHGGGSVRNGSAADTTALIEGASGGLFASGGASLRIVNFGTIRSAGTASAYGAKLRQPARLTNGSAADAGALISGKAGVLGLAGRVTITNFGTIAGTGGTAVRLASASDKLRVEAGAVFEGAVRGGGAQLALASGRGAIDALSGGDVTVSARGRATTYSNFGSLKLAKGARFTLTGTGAITVGGTATLIDNGRLIVTGALAVSGALLGRGAIVLAGGASVEVDSAAPASLSMAFKSGATGTLALGDPAHFAATIAGFAAGETIDLINAAATSAVLNASDQLVITNGVTTVATLQLRGDYAGASFDLASDGHGGTAITLTPGPAAAPAARLISAMASMTAGAGAAVAPVWKPEEAVRPLLAGPRTALA